MTRRLQLLVSGLLLALTLVGTGGAPATVQASVTSAQPAAGPSSLTAAIATGCVFDPAAMLHTISYAVDVTNAAPVPISVFYTVLLDGSDSFPPLWDEQDRTSRTAVILPPGTTTLAKEFSRERLFPQYSYYQVSIALEQSTAMTLPQVFSSDPDILCAYERSKR